MPGIDQISFTSLGVITFLPQGIMMYAHKTDDLITFLF